MLVALLGFASTNRLAAQSFVNLHNLSFTSDGAYPFAGLVLSGDTLYWACILSKRIKFGTGGDR